ncbi:MAG: DUF4157 domain-containing protein [Candidatus Promineifilaceae bacterium]
MQATAAKAPAKAENSGKETATRKSAVTPESQQQTPLWADISLPIQFSLKVNTPGDKYEREADRVAERVMRMPEPQVQRKTCACGKPAGPDGLCDDCRRKKQLGIQRKAKGEGGQTAVPANVHKVLQQPGRPLDSSTRQFMESRFGQRFEGVRVHTGGEAAESARSLNARAYTVGRNLVFGGGEYTPGTVTGRRLLAHELAHVIQQGGVTGGTIQRKLQVSPNPSSQSPADDPARRLTSAQRFDTVNNLITNLSSNFQVDTTNGEVKPNGIDCNDPTQVAGGSNPVANCCLCTLTAPNPNPWTIFVSETIFPSTNEGTRQVITPPADSAIEYGHWTASDQRTLMSRTLVLGHELCGHASLMELNAHPASAERTTTNVHDPTVRIQNALALEQGVSPTEARGLAASGSHRGESIAQITVKKFPLNGLWVSQIPDLNERRKVSLAAQLIRDNAMWVDIVGHSDPVGSDGAKQRVSDQRAQQMKRTLRARGVSERVSRRDLENSNRFVTVGAFANTPRFTSVRGVSDSQPPPAPQQADNSNWRRVDIFMTAFPAGAENIPSGTPTTVNPVPTPTNVATLAAGSNACHSLLVRRAYGLPIQFSLKVNAPGDKYEREADRVAEQVMRMPAEPQIQRKTCACGKPAGPDGLCDDCRRKRARHAVQRQSTKHLIQRAPLDGFDLDTSTAGMHQQLSDEYAKESGSPAQPGMQYTPGYEAWLAGEADKYKFQPPKITRQNPLDRLHNGRLLSHTFLKINGRKFVPGGSIGAIAEQYRQAITPPSVTSVLDGAGVRCRFGDDFKIQSSAEIVVNTAPGPNGWQKTLSPNDVLLPADQPRCAGKAAVPVTLRGKPTDSDYAKIIENGEMEHVHALEQLHNKHFVPFYHFVRGLTATGTNAGDCEADLRKQIGKRDEQAAMGFVFGDLAETQRFDDPALGTHHARIIPTIDANCNGITLTAGQTNPQQGGLGPGNVRTIAPTTTAVNPANLTVNGSDLIEGGRTIHTFSSPANAATALGIFQHYGITEINRLGTFEFLLVNGNAPSGAFGGLNERPINPDYYQVTFGVTGPTDWAIVEVVGDHANLIHNFNASRDRAYSAVALMQQHGFNREVWLGAANNPEIRFFRKD